jgi:GT2 family glycosyltransferase
VQVSFVIPLFNCLELTRAGLAGLQQTIPSGVSHEIILVDDGSTDGTREWLSTLAEPFVVLLNERNLGYAKANNRGASVARGRLLVLLNNDLIFSRGWLQPMLQAHARLGPRAGVVGNVQRNARTGQVDHSGIIVNHKGKPEHDTRLCRWPGHSECTVAAVTGACLLIERALYLSLGGFDEGFLNGGEDVDLCLRLEALGRTNVVALRSVIRHHISASPGRKRRDEENSRRLTLRWRSALASHGVRRWCLDYLEREWSGPTASNDLAFARSALAYVLHLRSTPPPRAMAGINEAIDREMIRWQALLDVNP